MAEDQKFVELAHLVMGKSVEEAEKLAKSYDVDSIRPVRVDGNAMGLHENIDEARLNVDVTNGVISAVLYLG